MTNKSDKHNNTIIHRTPPALKLLALVFISLGLFLLPSLEIIMPALGITFFLYFLAGFSFLNALRHLRPVWWLLLALFFVGFLTQSWQQGLVVSLRLGTILLIANLVTTTTPTFKMMATFEHIFIFLKPFGVRPSKIALVLSLTLRFIPVLSQIIEQVREAQKTRGLEHNLVAIIMPTLIRMLKMSDDVANAIEARGYDE